MDDALDPAPGAREAFSQGELDDVHALWMAVSEDHVWTGWAASGAEPVRIDIFRRRANWRRFPLTKAGGRYRLSDERGRVVAESATLAKLLSRVEAIPGLSELREG